MSLNVSLQNVRPLDVGLWKAEVPPHQLRMFGECRRTDGHRSILFVDEPSFDITTATLSFSPEEAAVVSVGTTSEILVIDRRHTQEAAEKDASRPPAPAGQGDREFLRVVSDLPSPAREAAHQLLARVRAYAPGDLKRGERLNFSETPDNFWYVVVQPRAGDLSITVRGAPNTLPKTHLETKVDRPGYTRFKVAGPSDLDAAMVLIKSSRRRRPTGA